jgi:hypothetical protein
VGFAFDRYYCNDLAGDQGYFKKEIMFNRSIIPLVIIFLVFGILILVFRTKLHEHGFDWELLSGGNLIVYLVTVFSMHLLQKSLHAENTQAFLRHAYGGIMIKLFACAAAAFIYILVAGADLNKRGLLVCMGFYIVYTAVELNVIMKHSKAKKHVEN